MVLSESENSTPKSELTVNTNFFSHEDLNLFLDTLEQTSRSSSKKNDSKTHNRSICKKAQKTSEEIFECSMLDDDQFLQAMEDQTSYVPNISLSRSVEDIMKYFGEDVTLDLDDMEEYQNSSNEAITKYRKFDNTNRDTKEAQTSFDSPRYSLSSTVQELVGHFKELTMNNAEDIQQKKIIKNDKENFLRNKSSELLIYKQNYTQLNNNESSDKKYFDKIDKDSKKLFKSPTTYDFLEDKENSSSKLNCVSGRKSLTYNDDSCINTSKKSNIMYKKNESTDINTKLSFFETSGVEPLNKIISNSEISLKNSSYDFLEDENKSLKDVNNLQKQNSSSLSDFEREEEIINNDGKNCLENSSGYFRWKSPSFGNKIECSNIESMDQYGKETKQHIFVPSENNCSIKSDGTNKNIFTNDIKPEHFELNNDKNITEDDTFYQSYVISKSQNESLISSSRMLSSIANKNKHLEDLQNNISRKSIGNLISENDLMNNSYNSFAANLDDTTSTNVRKIAAMFLNKTIESTSLKQAFNTTSPFKKPIPKQRTIFLNENENDYNYTINKNESSIRLKIKKFNEILEQDHSLLGINKSNEKYLNSSTKEIKQPALGVVICERQKSVKYLAQQFEDRLTFLKETSYERKEIKNEVHMNEEINNSHISSLTILLKSDMNSYKKEEERANSQTKLKKLLVPTKRNLDFQPLSINQISPSKRNNKEFSPSIITDIFAPPKKIRRTSGDPEVFLKNPKLERLFYQWFRSCGSTLVKSQKQNIHDLEIEQNTLEKSQNMENKDNEETKLAITYHKQENENFRSLTKEDSGISISTENNLLNQYYSSDENYSVASTIPKVTTDESQPDSLDGYYERAFEVVKVKTPRRKRRIVLSKEDLTTDSDNDEISRKIKDGKKVKPIEEFINENSESKDEFDELDEGIRRIVISPSTVKSTYTLTFLTSPSVDGELWDKESARLSLKGLSRSCPSLSQEIEEEEDEINKNSSDQNKKSFRRSSLSDEIENTTKKRALLLPFKRASCYETGGRWSTLQMQVIKEEDNEKSSSSGKSPDSIDYGVCLSSANSTSPAISKTGVISNPCNNRFSLFWITSGEFSVSTEIFYNPEERLRTLYNLFSQKCNESHNDLHFGIDHLEYSNFQDIVKENVVKRLPRSLGCSQYWILSGDFAIAFKGKYLCEKKIKWFFNFIRDSATSNVIRFGVDNIEFSTLPHLDHEKNYYVIIGINNDSTQFTKRTIARKINYNDMERRISSYSSSSYSDEI